MDRQVGGEVSDGAAVGLQTVTLQMEGLSCSCEAQLVEKKVRSLAGIGSADADGISQQLKVSYDPALTNVQDIMRSVAETGVNASLVKKTKVRSTWWRERQQLALFGTAVLILVAVGIRFLSDAPMLAVNIIYVLAVVVGVFYPARKALIALRNLTPTIHLLMLIGAGGAMALGMWQESAILIFVYSLGDVLESYAVDKARGALRSLAELVPKEALVRRSENQVTIAVEDIGVGDVVIVRPGERIPMDGKVAVGSSYLDQAAVTGESIPARKEAGDEVFAGTMNQNGSLEIEVDRPASETMLSKIICSVEEAQAKKTSYQRFSDAFGKYYTPAMFVLGVLVAVIPPLFFAQPWHPFLLRGLVVFVVSCSCGLALSVPVAVVASMANAARHGTLFKGGAYIETVSHLRAIAFDKTGTLTIGRPEVTDIRAFGSMTEDELLRMVGVIESRSAHPIAAAIVRRAREEESLDAIAVDAFEETSGLGISAVVGGRGYLVGNPRLQEESGVEISAEIRAAIAGLEDEGKTVVVVAREKSIVGLVAVADKVRPGAKDALERLQRAGVRTIMLSGDNILCARAVAAQVGVDEYHAQLLPTDKVELLKKLRDKYRLVGMVGDGINDAPAMAVSDVGIAMGAAGTDIAVEAGDVVLMSDDLEKVGYLRELSSRAARAIKQNIAISMANVAFMVVMALLGYLGLVTGLLLNEGSALFVILNALRLLGWRGNLAAAGSLNLTMNQLKVVYDPSVVSLEEIEKAAAKGGAKTTRA
ncbi:MAG: cation-translocating P-type ATPase [Thermoleophilia bacterium]|nr:cation-translocating P-type ATPase [Thermoleophilia bacterium]